MKWMMLIICVSVSTWLNGQVTIEEPVGVDRVLSDYARMYPMDEEVQGWSILVALNRDRRKIDDIQRELRYRYPEFGDDVKWRFENPYYKIIIGAFEERVDALVLLDKIRKKYPGAFEVKNSFPRAEIIQFQRRIRL